MKKRILSLVLCAVMLLSMCLFMGAGVTQDAAEAAGEVPQTAVFTEAGPFRPAVSVRPQPLRAAADRAAGGDGLELSKEVTANGSGYTVHLEAYTTGTVTTTTSIAPCDIVLVLDQSGSMAYNFDGNETSTDSARRQYAMKQAVNTFIEAVADKYNAEKSDHRIAVVTFGTNASTLMDWTLVTPGRNGHGGKPVRRDRAQGQDQRPPVGAGGRDECRRRHAECAGAHAGRQRLHRYQHETPEGRDPVHGRCADEAERF